MKADIAVGVFVVLLVLSGAPAIALVVIGVALVGLYLSR